MRFLATIQQEPAARKFGDYLLARDIQHHIEAADEGWDLWIENEDDMDRAQQELDGFQKNPDDPRFAQASGPAARRRAEMRRQEKKLRRNFVDVRTHWATRLAPSGYPVTILLIALSILVTAAVHMGKYQFGPAINALRISPMSRTVSFTNPNDFEHALNVLPAWQFIRDGQWGDLLRTRWAGLSEVRHGQLWRLITPVFIHFGILHILFDLWWLYDLGAMTEAIKGKWKLLGIVLLSGVIGNLAQFFWKGPNFGGMSGVVYGLFGYIWIKGLLEPQEGLAMPTIIVWFMLGWLVACMTGFLGPVGNGAHLFGLLSGVAIAAAPHGWTRLRRAMRARITDNTQ